MKRIEDLKEKRSKIISQMEEILKVEDLTAEKRAEWNDLNTKIEEIDNEIRILERQEELNKQIVVELKENNLEKMEERKDLVIEFRDWLKNSVENGGKTSFRADPLVSTTQSAMINKGVASEIDVLYSPSIDFLKKLGVTFFTDLNGNFVVPSMAEDLATFPGEDADAASANMAPDALTLSARRVTHRQSISRETLSQTNPGIYQSILQNLINGIYNAVTYDLFDQIDTDAATQMTVATATGLVYKDIVKMEASIGGLSLNSPAYVTTPSVKAYLKTKSLLGTENGPAWSLDNTLNGYPAYGTPAANANKVYFGDWTKVCVGQWGPIEIVVDPYSDAKKGLINITAIGLFDTGCMNKRAFCILKDVSAGL